MSNRKLLLADDSVTIQKVINLTFADEGVDVMAVGDGDTAMERFWEFRPDIVLADVNMPGLNGYQICERLRQNGDSTNIPVILLVGSFEPFDENEARRVGANDWITKPFQSIRQLVAKVSGLLDAPEVIPTTEPEPVAAGHDGHNEEHLAEAPSHFHPTENEDIDSLYRQSIAETVELPSSFRPEPVLGDTGMDDDMIEMSYAGGVVEQPNARDFEFVAPVESAAQQPAIFEPAAEQPAVFEPEPLREEIVEETVSPVDQYSYDDDNATLPAIDFTPVDVPPRVETSFDFSEPEDQPQDQAVSEVVEEKLPEYTRDPEPHLEMAAETAPLSYETRPDIADISLLEIPFAGNTPAPGYRSDEDVIGLDAPSSPPGREDLSPEFIEAVARKVIEKISENVIRQIAWQVVPQVADSVIREKTRRESEQ